MSFVGPASWGFVAVISFRKMKCFALWIWVEYTRNACTLVSGFTVVFLVGFRKEIWGSSSWIHFNFGDYTLNCQWHVHNMRLGRIQSNWVGSQLGFIWKFYRITIVDAHHASKLGKGHDAMGICCKLCGIWGFILGNLTEISGQWNRKNHWDVCFGASPYLSQ